MTLPQSFTSCEYWIVAQAITATQYMCTCNFIHAHMYMFSACLYMCDSSVWSLRKVDGTECLMKNTAI